MVRPLDDALAEVRALLLDPGLTRAVAAGRRRGQAPSVVRAEVRPVTLKGGTRLQIVTNDGARPHTRNVTPGPEAGAAVDALLAEPFGNWHVETADATVQLRVTKKGEAQVHRAAAARAAEPAAHDRAKEYLLDPGDPLFDAIGGNAAKRRQVDAFLRALAASVTPLPERLRVVDLGCGNAYLTFAAYRYLAGQGVDVEVVGVDVREDQRRRNTELAERLGCADRVRFVAGTIADARVDLRPGAGSTRSWARSDQLELRRHPGPKRAERADQQSPGAGGIRSEERSDEAGWRRPPGAPSERSERDQHSPDLVLALHACDTATDEALARAVRWEAQWVLAAPCCHHDIAAQLRGRPAPEPYPLLTRQGILRERFADVLTDALRAALLRLHGYRVDVVEFVDSRHTPRNLLLRARRTDAPPTEAQRAEYARLVDEWGVAPALERLLTAGG